MTQIGVMRKIARQGNCAGVPCEECPWNGTGHKQLYTSGRRFKLKTSGREHFNAAANEWLDEHDPDQLLFHIELEERP